MFQKIMNVTFASAYLIFDGKISMPEGRYWSLPNSPYRMPEGPKLPYFFDFQGCLMDHMNVNFAAEKWLRALCLPRYLKGGDWVDGDLRTVYFHCFSSTML